MLLRAIYLSKKVVACRPLRSMANGDMSTCQGCLQFGFIPTITPEIADLTQKTTSYVSWGLCELTPTAARS